MKKAWKSKTELFKGVFIVLAAAEMILAKGLIPIPPQAQVLIIAVVNALLRFFTHDSITVKPGTTE